MEIKRIEVEFPLLKKAAKYEMQVLRRQAAGAPTRYRDAYADIRLRSCITDAIDRRLEEARDNGRGGWWREDECTIEVLRAGLQRNFEQGDMLDAIIYCAMIYMRETPK